MGKIGNKHFWKRWLLKPGPDTNLFPQKDFIFYSLRNEITSDNIAVSVVNIPFMLVELHNNRRRKINGENEQTIGNLWQSLDGGVDCPSYFQSHNTGQKIELFQK